MRYVPTPTASVIFNHVERARLVRCNILITGAAGVGKTAALTFIARADRKAAMMTATPARRSMRATLLGVTDAFGWPHDRQHISDVDDVLRNRLPDAIEAGRYLVVDEAQLLHHDVHRQLLHYYDAFGLPIVFAGNEHVLKKTRVNAAAFDQIASRIATHVRLKGITAGDIDAFGVEFNVEGKDAYELMRCFGAGRNCRDVVHLLEEAHRLAGADRIRLPIIREAVRCLHGRDALKQLFTPQAV